MANEPLLPLLLHIRRSAVVVVLLVIGFIGASLVGLFSPTQAADTPPAGAKAGPTAEPSDDPLPAGAVLQLGTARLRHGHQVQNVAFAPDGKTFASTGWDHLARLWDAETGKAIRTFGEQDQRMNPYATSRWLHSLAFSPDGQLLAAGEFATNWNIGTIRIWEVATGKKLHELMGDQSGVLTLAFSPDSKVLASGSVNGTVRLWNVDQGTEMNQLAAGMKSVLTIAFRDKGQRLVVHGANGQVQFWKTPKDQRIEKEGDPLSDVDVMACSPDGSLLALGDARGKVRLWDPATHKELRQWSAGQEAVRCLSFSPDGKVLTAGTEGGVVKVWEVGGKEVGTIAKHRGPIKAVAVSPDGKQLASVVRDDIAVGLWDVASGKPVVKSPGYDGQVRPLRFSPDGKTLLSSSRDRVLHRWDAATGQLLRTLKGEHFADHAAALAPDGKTAAWAGGPGVIHIFDWQTGQEVRQWKALGAGIWALAFSPDGKLVAATAGNDTLGVWDTATGQAKLSEAVKDGDNAALLLFSPDGKKLLRLSGKTGGRLLDVATGEWTTLPQETSAGLGAAFSPDGSLLAIGGTAGTVGLWDATHGRLLRTLERQPGYVQSLTFSRDGRTLAAGSWKSVYLWETATGLERGRFESLEGDTWSLAFSPDGRVLAAGCGDSTIVFLGLGTPTKALSVEELARQWKILGGDEAGQAFQALKALAGSPEQALSLLQKELKPTPKNEAGKVEKLIADLDSDEFTKREKAREELEKLGPSVVGALRKVLTNAPSVEVRKRAEVLLERIEGTQVSPERVTMLRRLELLERLATKDAQKLLEHLAAGEPAAEQTLEADRALKRLAAN